MHPVIPTFRLTKEIFKSEFSLYKLKDTTTFGFGVEVRIQPALTGEI